MQRKSIEGIAGMKLTKFTEMTEDQCLCAFVVWSSIGIIGAFTIPQEQGDWALAGFVLWAAVWFGWIYLPDTRGGSE